MLHARMEGFLLQVYIYMTASALLHVKNILEIGRLKDYSSFT